MKLQRLSLSFLLFRKFLFSKKSRFISFFSIISIFGIALGVATLIITLSVLSGLESSITDKIINFNSHIVLQGFSNKNIHDYRLSKPFIEKRFGKEITSLSPFAAKNALIKYKSNVDGILLKGILPEFDKSDLKRSIVEGSYDLSANDSLPKVIVGKKIADLFNFRANSKVTLITLKNNHAPSIDNPPAVSQFIVSGIFESGMAEYDNNFVYTNLHDAQNFFEIGNQISGYDIKIKDITKADSLAKVIYKSLGYPYYAKSIFDIYSNIFTWIDLQKKPIPIILGLIILVAVFNIISTLLINVIQKVEAVGIIRTLGLPGKYVLLTFVFYGCTISFIGIIIGNFFAYLLSYIQLTYNIVKIPGDVYFVSKFPLIILPTNYILVSIATFVMGVLLSIVPGYIAARISPLKAIKFE